MSGILWIIIVGFVAGIIARLLSPGPNNPGGFILTTVLGIAVVIAVIGYRVFRNDGRPVETTALLPKGARVVQTAVAGDRIIVTVDIGGMIEIRTFDAHTLRPQGRLQFAVEP